MSALLLRTFFYEFKSESDIIDDLEKLLIFMYTSDIIGCERIVSSDSPCDEEFIQKGIHLYFQEPIFSIYSQEDHVE